MLAFLRQPLPFETNTRKAFFSCLLTGAFIAVFLIVFQPLGISSWQDPLKIPCLAGFGAISFLVPFIAVLILYRLFPDAGDHWSVWKELLFMLSFILLIAVTCYSYTLAITGGSYSFISFADSTIGTLIVSTLPVTANVYVKYRNYKAQHGRIAEDINSQLPAETTGENYRELTLVSENGREELTLNASTLLFIRAADNYSEIHYLEGGQLKKTLLRSSLKRLEARHDATGLVRCHRSTLVNLRQVQSIEGNSQGYIIRFHTAEITVPVSRNFGSAILSRLRELQT